MKGSEGERSALCKIYRQGAARGDVMGLVSRLDSTDRTSQDAALSRAPWRQV